MGWFARSGRGSSARVRYASSRRWASACLIGAGIVATAGSARADVSSWLFVGTGPSWVRHASGTTSQLSLQIDTGMGTPPSEPVVIGGLFRLQPHFGHGSDVALLLRTATRDFVNGGWGGAIDLGGYERWWGPGSGGASGSLVLGAPWGITLSATGTLGSNDERSVSAVLGIDFARLTVYRTTGGQWWPNTFPAYRPGEDDRSP